MPQREALRRKFQVFEIFASLAVKNFRGGFLEWDKTGLRGLGEPVSVMAIFFVFDLIPRLFVTGLVGFF